MPTLALLHQSQMQIYLTQDFTPDMTFVKNFTPPDFQAKDFTPLILLNFNSFSDKNTKKLVFLEKFTPLAKKFKLQAAVMAVTNLTSEGGFMYKMIILHIAIISLNKVSLRSSRCLLKMTNDSISHDCSRCGRSKPPG